MFPFHSSLKRTRKERSDQKKRIVDGYAGEVIPPLSYHNLREIQAAMRKDFFEPIDGVVQVMLQHASSSYLQLLAAMRERG